MPVAAGVSQIVGVGTNCDTAHSETSLRFRCTAVRLGCVGLAGGCVRRSAGPTSFAAFQIGQIFSYFSGDSTVNRPFIL